MRLLEIEKIARGKGITNTWKYSKKDLIKTIQKAEGYSDCFATANKNCIQMNCCWRNECIK